MYKIQNTALRHEQADDDLILNNLHCMLSTKQCNGPVLYSTLQKNMGARDKEISFDKGCLLNVQDLDKPSQSNDIANVAIYSKLEMRALSSEGSIPLETQSKLLELIDTQTEDNIKDNTKDNTSCVTQSTACAVCVTNSKDYLDVCTTCYILLKQFCGSQDKRGGRILSEM